MLFLIIIKQNQLVKFGFHLTKACINLCIINLTDMYSSNNPLKKKLKKYIVQDSKPNSVKKGVSELRISSRMESNNMEVGCNNKGSIPICIQHSRILRVIILTISDWLKLILPVTPIVCNVRSTCEYKYEVNNRYCQQQSKTRL